MPTAIGAGARGRPTRGRLGAALRLAVLAVGIAGVATGVADARPGPPARAAAAVSPDVTARVAGQLVDVNTTLGLRRVAGAGTGMVVSATGEIITNNHVIEGATKITVTAIGNGRTYRARVLGYDRSRDVAVLALVGASGLEPVSFADSSSKVHVGQRVASIGNAGGRGGAPAVAAGTVLALHRTIVASDGLDGSVSRLRGLIEFRGHLAPGDSGGPLVNAAGRVVGMNSAGSSNFTFGSTSPTRGFAIPVNSVRAIADRIRAGQGSRTIHVGATAFLGVLATNAIGGGAHGVVVNDTISASPAASAGLRSGDVITSLDGRTVTSTTALALALVPLHPGDRVPLTWLDSSGAQQTATVALATGPAG